MRSCALAALVALALAGPARAAMSDGVVRIGVLTDMGGPYSDNVGAGAVLAARMAVEDFGGTVAGVPVEVLEVGLDEAELGVHLRRRPAAEHADLRVIGARGELAQQQRADHAGGAGDHCGAGHRASLDEFQCSKLGP